jgi:hypothetical protein
MSNDNRVLSRLGARELTQEETDRVSGSRSIGTQTGCTLPGLNLSFFDGDPGDGCPPLR